MPNDNTITVFHGSTTWFERPDPDYAAMGDGNSSHGLGFNVTDNLRYVHDHLNTRRHAEGDAVIYALDLDRARILDWTADHRGHWLDRAAEHAQSQGCKGLVDELRVLQRASAASQPFALREIIQNTFPDQRLENEFLRGMGVQAVRTLEVIVVIDYGTLPPLKVQEVIGAGPKNMPKEVKAGDLAARHHRLDAEVQLAKNDLWSQELTDAWRRVQATGNERLITAFRIVAKILLTDAYIKAEDLFLLTRQQSMGFDIRNSIGLAVQRGLSAQAPSVATSEMRDTVEKLKKFMAQYLDVDPQMIGMIDDLSSATAAHADRTAAVAKRAEAAIIGGTQSQAARGSVAVEGEILGRLAASGRLDAFAHAEAAIRAVGRLDGADGITTGILDALKARVAEALRTASKSGTTKEGVDRLIMPIAADVGRATCDDRWLHEVSYQFVAAIRSFVQTVADDGINLETHRPMDSSEVKISVSPASLLAAMGGNFNMAQGIELPITGYKGWAVTQKGGMQILKHDGKLATFADMDQGIIVPAVVRDDGRVVDVTYGEGGQLSINSDVASFSNRAIAPSMPRMTR